MIFLSLQYAKQPLYDVVGFISNSLGDFHGMGVLLHFVDKPFQFDIAQYMQEGPCTLIVHGIHEVPIVFVFSNNETRSISGTPRVIERYSG